MSTATHWLRPELAWFVIGLVMLLLELSMPALVIFFFGVGAWVTAIVCAVAGISINAQLVLFTVSSVALLLTLRRWLTRVFRGKITEAGQDADPEYLGKRATVVRAIEPGLSGRVELFGSHWDAEADEAISEGSPVTIIGKNNITFKVKAIQRG